MTIDISKFLPMFFQENCATQQDLVAQISGMSIAEPGDALNRAIRAAHLIKGSAGAFGFGETVALAEAIEHVLVRVQRGSLGMSEALKAACIEGATELGCLLERRRDSLPVDASLATRIGARLDGWLAENPAQ